MSEWQKGVEDVKKAVLADEPAAALSAALGLFARFGEIFELLAIDIERIANAMAPSGEQAVEPAPANNAGHGDGSVVPETEQPPALDL